MQTQTTAKLPLLARAARIAPSSINEKERTVDVVWSTGARVLKLDDWGDPFEEELSLEGDAIRLERINSGGPVLDSHRDWTLSDQIGVVRRAWIRPEQSEAWATLQMSARSAVMEEHWRGIGEGVISNISCLYHVYQYRDVTPDGSPRRVLRAVDWEPYSIDWLPIPADHLTGARSASAVSNCVILPRSGRGAKPTTTDRTMDPEDEPEENGQGGTGASTGSPSDANAGGSAGSQGTGGGAGEAGGGSSPGSGEGSGGGASSSGSPPAPAAAPAPASTAVADPPAGRAPSVTPEAREQILREERARVDGIHRRARAAGLPREFGEQLSSRSVNGRPLTVDEAGQSIFEELERRSGINPQFTPSGVTVGEETETKRRRAIDYALSSRARVATDADRKAAGADARHYQSLSLMEMGREMLEQRGVRTRGMSRLDVAGAILSRRSPSHGTGDFPSLLENIARKVLKRAYAAAPLTYRSLGVRENAPDFKTMSRAQLSGLGTLPEVLEDQEITFATATGSKETYALGKFAKRFAMTREAIVNDDLRAFERIPRAFGNAAGQTENNLAWLLWTGNSANGVVMGDGVALFNDGAHGNVVSGAALDVAGLGAAREKLRLQTDPDGTHINLRSQKLVVPAALETDADKYTAEIQPDSGGNANPFSSVFDEIVVEPRLDATSQAVYYVAADPAQLDIFVYGGLEGEGEGPRVETTESWPIDGVEYRAILYFYVSMADWRGVVKVD